MSLIDQPVPSVSPAVPRKHRPLIIGLTLAAMAVLLVFIVSLGKTLWGEISTLRAELALVRETEVIGYQGITPRFSYAQKPREWFRQEGEFTMLWSNWQHGEGHRWFRFNRGEIEPTRIAGPLGRDVIQAIDHPLVENTGGLVWQRIPDEAPVLGYQIAGVDTAYPMLLLTKVIVVNDTIREHPFLVISNPLAERVEDQTSVYESVLDGRRVTMGVSGYFSDRKPLLYDRGTESFWVGDGDELRSIAGKHRGQRLRRIARPTTVAWSLWRTQHPGCRLVVGADRSHAMPEL